MKGIKEMRVQSIYRRTYGVMVSTLDFESNNPSSILGMSFFNLSYFSDYVFFLLVVEAIILKKTILLGYSKESWLFNLIFVISQ